MDSLTSMRKKAWVKRWRQRMEKQQEYQKWERERWKRELKCLDNGGDHCMEAASLWV